MSSEKTCAELIDDRLRSREQSLADIYKAIEKDESIEGYEEANDALYEFALGVALYTTVRIDLSTGGPADWLECMVDRSGSGLINVTYHYSDWFDHAEESVDVDSPLWNYADEMVETFLYS